MALAFLLLLCLLFLIFMLFFGFPNLLFFKKKNSTCSLFVRSWHHPPQAFGMLNYFFIFVTHNKRICRH
ncbi:hypothetical protein BX661DRAFT_184321 [Kickxella alabastrina]|uniref:uncharacterized protein n=1 Tax=Kickxella alabastrina TaxID=61397 RepID=UPI00221FB45B|nr:uncharacterized protein BX661DRAFT_184321 [Kickxella alabastrina]KAI7825870.1 hypothetical protein BX661DRAFT_184321 [Kickxella alabastrina]